MGLSQSAVASSPHQGLFLCLAGLCDDLQYFAVGSSMALITMRHDGADSLTMSHACTAGTRGAGERVSLDFSRQTNGDAEHLPEVRGAAECLCALSWVMLKKVLSAVLKP